MTASYSASDFDAALARLPRVRLVPEATPIHRLDRLRDSLGGPNRVPTLLVKRDDLNGVASAGTNCGSLSGCSRTRWSRGRTYF